MVTVLSDLVTVSVTAAKSLTPGRPSHPHTRAYLYNQSPLTNISFVAFLLYLAQS